MALAVAALPLCVNVLGGEPGGATPPAAQKDSKVEQRLERLEKMIEDLGQQLLPGATADGGRTEAADDLAPDDDAPLEVPADLAEIQKSFAEVVKRARLNLQLSETNLNRTVAAARQAEAVRKAYAADTVTLDQLLETQRRLVESQVSYARTVSELCADPVQRQYLFEQARLVALNRALNDARRVWKDIHQAYLSAGSGDEAQQEAQAREQYFLFKTDLRRVLPQFEQAKAAAKAAEQQSEREATVPDEDP